MGLETEPGKVQPKLGSVYSLTQNPDDDKKALVNWHFGDVDISNGLEWSLDGKTFYYIDTLSFKLQAFDFDGTTGKLSNRRDIFVFKEHNVEGCPDGMTIDNEGHLWVAMWGSGKVRIHHKKVVSCVENLGQISPMPFQSTSIYVNLE